MAVICGHTDILLVNIIEIVRNIGFEEVCPLALLAEDGDGEVEDQGHEAVLEHPDQSPHGCSISEPGHISLEV